MAAISIPSTGPNSSPPTMTGSEAKVMWKLHARKPTIFNARYRAASIPVKQILRAVLL